MTDILGQGKCTCITLREKFHIRKSLYDSLTNIQKDIKKAKDEQNTRLLGELEDIKKEMKETMDSVTNTPSC